MCNVIALYMQIFYPHPFFYNKNNIDTIDEMLQKIFRIKLPSLGLLFFAVLSLFFSLNNLVSASETIGTIDSTYKEAWGERTGWLNFGCDNCNVRVTDTAVTGNFWSVQYGWINLRPVVSGVTNNGEGILAGSAWGKNIGWINFSGVTINSSGEFLGYATILSDSSVISFNCINTNSCAVADYKVKTDWRPASIRSGSGGAPPGGGGGGVLPPVGGGGGTTPPSGGGGSSEETRILPIIISIIGNNIEKVFTSIQGSVNNPNVKKIEQVSVAIPVAVSTFVLLPAFLSGLPFLNYLFYLFIALMQILGIRKTPKPWGTVYDSVTKRPIPFARVEILNKYSRKLQTVIADENGRYGFLLADDLAKEPIELKAFRTKYDFPSKEIPTQIEQELYPNIYKGGQVNITSALTNFDLPMDPREKSISHNFYFGIVSVQLNNALADIANFLFAIGSVLGIASVVVNPNKNNFIILGIIVLTSIIRSTGFKLKPFGLTKDKITSEAIPFGFVALHNPSGDRVNFTVSDDKGRYFLLTKKGGYVLKAYTPAHILPTRTEEIPVFTNKGWISKEIKI